MNVARIALLVSIASSFVVAPVGYALAVDAHHPAQAGKKSNAQSIGKKKSQLPKRVQGTKQTSHGPMSMGGKMMTCPMMQGAQTPRRGMMHHGTMTAGSALPMAPWHSLRMQWHHSMMMWHHNMMHGQPMKCSGS